VAIACVQAELGAGSRVQAGERRRREMAGRPRAARRQLGVLRELLEEHEIGHLGPESLPVDAVVDAAVKRLERQPGGEQEGIVSPIVDVNRDPGAGQPGIVNASAGESQHTAPKVIVRLSVGATFHSNPIHAGCLALAARVASLLASARLSRHARRAAAGRRLAATALRPSHRQGHLGAGASGSKQKPFTRPPR